MLLAAGLPIQAVHGLLGILGNLDATPGQRHGFPRPSLVPPSSMMDGQRVIGLPPIHGVGIVIPDHFRLTAPDQHVLSPQYPESQSPIHRVLIQRSLDEILEPAPILIAMVAGHLLTQRSTDQITMEVLVRLLHHLIGELVQHIAIGRSPYHILADGQCMDVGTSSGHFHGAHDPKCLVQVGDNPFNSSQIGIQGRDHSGHGFQVLDGLRDEARV